MERTSCYHSAQLDCALAHRYTAVHAPACLLAAVLVIEQDMHLVKILKTDLWINPVIFNSCIFNKSVRHSHNKISSSQLLIHNSQFTIHNSELLISIYELQNFTHAVNFLKAFKTASSCSTPFDSSSAINLSIFA